MPDTQFVSYDRTSPEYYAPARLALARMLDRLDYRATNNGYASIRGSGDPTDTHPYPLAFIHDPKIRLEAWFLESLLTALSTSDRKVALRATLQAYEYAGRMGVANEYQLDARNRCEAFLAD